MKLGELLHLQFPFGQQVPPGRQLTPPPHRHCPPAQVSLTPQRPPHPPQWRGSVLVLTQTPPQSVVPPGQVHDPPWQVFPPVQVPQEPPQPSSPHCLPVQLGAQIGGGGPGGVLVVV